MHENQKVLDECKGGVLIIDAVISNRNPEGRDSIQRMY